MCTFYLQLDEAVVVSERPAMDIFKAIFSDSSEEDGSSEEEADKTESDEPTESKTTPASRVLSSIFGNTCNLLHPNYNVY